MKTIRDENAEEFYPERWLDKSTLPSDLETSYMPFNIGKRNCIGREFALAEMMILTAVLVRRFELIWPDDAPRPQREFGLTMPSKKPIVMQLRRRSS